MNHLIHMINAPALNNSCAARIGRRLVMIGFGLKAARGIRRSNTQHRAWCHIGLGADTVRSVL